MSTEFEIIKNAICFATPENDCCEGCFLLEFCQHQADRYADTVKKRWLQARGINSSVNIKRKEGEESVEK